MSAGDVTPFQEFLRAAEERGGLQTDDVLAAFLPLCRAVVAAHEGGRVAPLRGVRQIIVAGGELGFDSTFAAKPERNNSKLNALLAPVSGAVEVVG